MTIDETIEFFETLEPHTPLAKDARAVSIDTMRKYQKLKQIKFDMLYDIYMAGINMEGEYHGCWVRFKDIENIVNGHLEEVLND